MKFRNSKLFKMSDSVKMNALIGSYFSSDPRLIADGYFLAANILIESLKDNPSNALVYPIVFLYRHYLELALKSILYEFERWGYPLKKEEKTGHNLTVLLCKVNTLCLEEFNKALSEKTCDVINSFNIFDPSSQTFRYSFDIDMNLNFPEPDTVGLETIKFHIENIEPELYGIVEEIRHRRDFF